MSLFAGIELSGGQWLAVSVLVTILAGFCLWVLLGER